MLATDAHQTVLFLELRKEDTMATDLDATNIF